MELDPDIRLPSRLALGRGWTVGGAFAMWLGAAFAVATGSIAWPLTHGRPAGLLLLGMAALVFGATRGVAQLVRLEHDERLNQTRLCGRPPHRILAGFFLGSIWPYAVLGALFVYVHARTSADWTSIPFAAIVLVAAADAVLIAFTALPAAVTRDQRVVMPLLLLVGGTSAFLFSSAFTDRSSTGDTRRVASALLLAIMTPAAAWLAARRIARPSSYTPRASPADPLHRLGRLVPRAGPPELMRQLRQTLASGGTLVVMLVTPVAALIVLAWLPADPHTPLGLLRIFGVSEAIPAAAALTAAFALSWAIRQEVESGTRDLVMLTPQRPAAIALGWYVGVAAPFWLAGLAAIALVAGIDRRAVDVPLWPVTLAILAPALALAEVLQRRRTGVYFALAVVMVSVGTAYEFAQTEGIAERASVRFAKAHPDQYRFTSEGFPRFRRGFSGQVAWMWGHDMDREMRALPGSELRRLEDPSYRYRRVLPAAVPLSAAVFALMAAAGRMRRPDGPSLTAAGICVAACAVGIAALAFRAAAIPRLYGAILVLIAPFAADEGSWPAAPFGRMRAAGIAAGVGGVLLTAASGIGWRAGGAMTVAAALAAAAAVVIHETARRRVVSAVLRIAVCGVLLRAWWSPDLPRAYPLIAGGLFPPVHLVAAAPPVPGAMDMLFLAFVAAAAAMVHARRRRIETALREAAA